MVDSGELVIDPLPARGFREIYALPESAAITI